MIQNKDYLFDNNNKKFLSNFSFSRTLKDDEIIGRDKYLSK